MKKNNSMGLKKWVSDNLKTIIISSFIIPILLVAFVSISHVTTFYGLANPLSWAIYLSVAIEIAALGALAGISANMGKFIYVPFGIVTFIQLIGNIFFSYTFIDETTELFQDWVDMVAPVVEPMGVESTDLVGHKRILSFFAGGLLPLISLTFAHMLVRFSEENKVEVKETEETQETKEELDIKVTKISPEEILNLSKEAGKLEKEILEKEVYRPTQEDLDRLQAEIDRLLSLNKDKEQEEVKEEVEVPEVIEERKINRLTYSPRNADNTEN
jgi:hypothetical protein